jgi:hypothetical protein
MATDLEEELVAVFASAGAALMPPPNLADRARQRVRERRRRLAWVAAVVALVVGSVSVAVAGHGSAKSPHKIAKVPHVKFRLEAANVKAMVVGGNTLYVAVSTYPRGLLTAYDRTTGAELGHADLPATPNSLVVAADGTVWVTFTPSNAGHRAGVTEFAATLNKRSTLLTNDHYLDAATFDVVPLGEGYALLSTGAGLATVYLPLVGANRVARANPNNTKVTMPTSPAFRPPARLAALSNGNVAALVNGDGERSRLVLEHGAATFAGSHMTAAASPEGLWVTTGTGPRSVLQRLSNTLAPLPIGAAASAVSLPSGVDRVWTSGRTVWVGTDDQRITLTCFAFSSLAKEPTATVSLPVSDSLEAVDPVVSGDLVIEPTAQQIYVASPFSIKSYPVPAACRT